MSTPVVAIRAIGECEIALGRARVKPDSVVLFALLLHLGLRAGERVTRAELLELLWADIPDASRRHSLRQLLYRVRRAGVDVDVDSDDLRLDRGRVTSDLSDILADRWPEQVALADIPAPSAILRAYEPALSPAYSEWVDAIRSHAAAQIRRAALRHIAVGCHEGRWPDVDLAARRCLEADPLNEEATLALAEATAMGGSKAEALRILDAYLWDIGDRGKKIGLPASVLRRRISDQPTFRVQRAGDPPLIARADDLAWLNTRAELAKATGTCTAMLLGPPGIGKTAVMRAFVAHAEMRGWRSAASRLQPSDVDRPMSVFVELLPSLLRAEGALGAAPESIAQLRRLVEHDVDDDILAHKSQEAEAVQARIRTSALDLLAAITHEGPMVLVLEDLHWIDRQSLRLLTWLIEHATPVPALWLLTARMENRFPELRESLPAESLPARTVEPLSRENATALFRALAPGMVAEGSTGTAHSAYDVTGGNPLFIREVAGHWTDTGGKERLPTNLKVLMRGRVGRLSPTAQRVLHCCAVLGRFATVPRVSTVLEISTSDLLACIEDVDALGLLGLGGEPGSLALHDLWQEELVSTLRPASLALLHLRCGEVLEAESRENRPASMVSEAVRHLLAAGVRERALRLLEDAAEYQLANGFSEDAANTSRLGLEHATSTQDCGRWRSLHLRSLQRLGHWANILGLLDTSADSNGIDRKQPTSHSAEELLYLESLLRTGRDPVHAVRRSLQCACDETASHSHRMAAALLVAQAAGNMFDTSAMSDVRRVIGTLRRDTPDDVGAALAAELVLESEIGSLDVAVDRVVQLIEFERQRSSVHALAKALRFGTHPYRAVGKSDSALQLARDAYDLAVRHQLVEQAAQSGDICATILMEVGDIDESEAWLDRASAWAGRISLAYSERSLAVLRVRLRLRRQDPAGALEIFRTHRHWDAPMTAREHLESISLRCRLFTALGQAVPLGEAVAELSDRIELSKTLIRHDGFAGALVLALRALGRPGEANTFAQNYVSEWRRDTAPLPSELRWQAD